jgi:FtsP/CotA-like multicopper oxidase with cupredoxin domain
MLTRRRFMTGAAGLALNGSVSRAGSGPTLGPMVEPGPGKTVAVTLAAAERPTALPCFGGRSLPLWTFAEGQWPPVIRLDLGDQLQATLQNRLPRAGEHTSIHWHGIRLPNDQDGVPYLVQPPVRPGEDHAYSFTPPDAGTYFFHTHCNTVEQLGRGLEGVLIIDGDVTEPYDADEVLLLRDWRVEPGEAEFAAFTSARGAGRAGSYGSLRSVNGAARPDIALPASGDCRLRIINTDPTRIMVIGIDGAEAAIIAIDGIAVAPQPLGTWSMGPAMRLDIVVRPPTGGGIASLIDSNFDDRVELARLVGTGAPRRSGDFDPAPLRRGRVPVPDPASAVRLAFRFQATAAGAAIAAADDGLGLALDHLCLSTRQLWSINGRGWPGPDHSALPPPLAILERGQSYVFSLKNETVFSHPIHIHGHFFAVLASNKRPLLPHNADTVLLLPDEEVEVAFVADNPGDWMFHCHIIEHQENGMMGYLRVA